MTTQMTINEITAIAEDSSTEESSKNGFFALVRKYASISDVLRIFGALGVATAMGIFLLDGVEVANDLYRFLTMLGFTTSLVAAGMLMSKLLKEQRGSRIFIGLGLLSISVNFTVFGALIYSVFPLDSLPANYPGLAHWTVASIAQVPMALAASAIVLLPVVWLGFTVLARSERNWLSTALILSSLFLLIPVRHELASTIIAITAAASSVWFIYKNKKDSLALKTAEGRFSVALLFVSPIIIAVRSLFLYEATGVLVLALCTGAYYGIRHMLSKRIDSDFITATLTTLAAVVALLIGLSITDLVDIYVPNKLPTVIGASMIILLAFDLNKVSQHKSAASAVGILLLIIATATMTMHALLANEIFISAVCAAILLAAAAYGYSLKEKFNAGIAMIGAVCIMAFNVATLWDLVSHTGWWGIGVAGALAIIAGSMLDRAGTVVEVKS